MASDTAEPAGIKGTSLLVRVITAIVYGVVLLAAIWLGPLELGLVMGLIAALAANEFFAITRREYRLPNEAVGVAAAAAMPIVVAEWGMPGLVWVATALIAIALILHATVVRARTVDTALTVFGPLYTGFLLAYLVLIRKFDDGGQLGLVLTVAVLLSVWLNDTLAYFVGSVFGRHKIAPRISPRKSWEGFTGGMVGSVVVWGLLPVFFPEVALTQGWAIVIGLATGVAVIIGDLAESRFKREAGVKDSGRLLPGHGGFLDRHDSLILVGLVAWCMLVWGGVT
jgi:phosphatidate cytidylyltransferase